MTFVFVLLFGIRNAEANHVLTCDSHSSFRSFVQRFSRQNPLQKFEYLFDEQTEFGRISIVYSEIEIQEVRVQTHKDLFKSNEFRYLDETNHILYEPHHIWKFFHDGSEIVLQNDQNSQALTKIPSLLSTISTGCLLYAQKWNSPLQIDALQHHPMLFHVQFEHDDYQLTAYTKIPFPISTQLIDNPKIPSSSQGFPFIRIGLGNSISNVLNDKQKKYVASGGGGVIYTLQGFEKEFFVDGRNQFELYLPIQTRFFSRPMPIWKMKFALRWLPQFTKMGFENIENINEELPTYSNTIFRLYLEKGGIVLTTIDRPLYTEKMTFADDEFVSFSENQSVSLEIMVPRRLQMVIGPLPFVRIGIQTFQDDWGIIQLTAGNSQLDGILHNFLMPISKIQPQIEYPTVFWNMYMAYVKGELQPTNLDNWMRNNQISGNISIEENSIQYDDGENIWKKEHLYKSANNEN